MLYYLSWILKGDILIKSSWPNCFQRPLIVIQIHFLQASQKESRVKLIIQKIKLLETVSVARKFEQKVAKL